MENRRPACLGTDFASAGERLSQARRLCSCFALPPIAAFFLRAGISSASVDQKRLAHPVSPDLTDAALDLRLVRSLGTQPFQRITL